MSLDNFKGVIDKLSPYLFHVRLHGWGEPLLNPDLTAMVRYAHEKGIYTNFHTNGHLFSEKIICEMIDAGLDEVNVALDGMSQETYEKYRVGGNLETVCDGIKRLRDIKEDRGVRHPLVNLQFLVMAHNEREIPLVKKFAHDAGLDQLVLKPLNLVFIDEKEVMEYLPGNEDSTRYKIENRKIAFKNEYRCTAVFMEVKLNWDGTVSLCVCDDTHGGHVSGNLFTDKIDDILFGKDFIEARGKSLKKTFEMCSTCEGEKSSI